MIFQAAVEAVDCVIFRFFGVICGSFHLEKFDQKYHHLRWSQSSRWQSVYARVPFAINLDVDRTQDTRQFF